MKGSEHKENEVLTIGWHGGSSHYSDLLRVIPVLNQIKQEYKDKINFRFFGARFDGLLKQLDVDIMPWIKPDLFFDRFSRLHYDIGVIPLENTQFNRCKSNIKWLECSYYNIPCVVENITPYKEHITHTKNALLFNTGDELYTALIYLIKNKQLRDFISSSANRYVVSNFNIDKYINKRISLYNKLLSNKSCI
jgi:glycosyltransferase involved in cell wall biosynthesis